MSIMGLILTGSPVRIGTSYPDRFYIGAGVTEGTEIGA